MLPTPGRESSLQSVSCVSSSDCWAVGSFSFRPGGSRSEALHWNGRRWSRVSVPEAAVGGGLLYGLRGVSCVSAADCWAVGYHERPGGPLVPLIMRWNGSRWSPESLHRASGVLFGVSCASALSCWAVGASPNQARNEAWHWNGRRWASVAVPEGPGTAVGDSNMLQGVACASASDCWAVGNWQNGHRVANQVLHWNGTRWVRSSTPDPGGRTHQPQDLLFAVSCAVRSRCWAVGVFTNQRDQYLNQALRWNGSKWSQAVPSQGGAHPNALLGIDCVRRSDCWAVGNFGRHGAQLNQAQRWNGSTWSVSATPNPGGTARHTTNFLSGISCSSASSCWAVGYSMRIGHLQVNDALRWNGRKWSTR
jgi:hypothetical protein